METFATYLLKSVIWITGFALVYLLFLRYERFFQLKRIYLLTGIIVSLIFPVISIHYRVEVPAPAVSEFNTAGFDLSASTAIPAVIQAGSFDYRLILLMLYVSGILFLGYRIIRHIVLLRKTINKANINNFGPARLVRISSFPASFSFFNYVFINPSVNEAEVREIMNHELVHVRQKHWLDLLLIEMLRLFQWINPFVWIYTGFVRLNNEYLADELALQRSSNPANYKAALLNQLFRSPVISLSNSFNYSLNKKRFDMMKKIVTSPYRKLKIFLVLPVFAIIFYAFATPEYNYLPSGENTINPLTIYQTYPIIQKEVKGIVLGKDGKPVAGVVIMSTVTSGNTHYTETGSDGKFTLTGVTDDASLLFGRRGYKPLTLKPVFTSEMKVTMEVDPDYKAPEGPPKAQFMPPRVVTIDGVPTDKTAEEARKDLGYNYGIMNMARGKASGDKPAVDTIKIITRIKALEMGLKPPFPRLTPDDYPTFQGKNYREFGEWIVTRATYPAEAKSQNIGGYITVNFTVGLNGSLSSITTLPSSNAVLAGEIIKVIRSSPKWEPPKNPAVDEPFATGVSIHFKLPDLIESLQEPFVVVEEMPMYPGGDGELLKFIQENTHYPEEARAQKIEGRVIARFFVSTQGTAEDVTVLRGVDPLLDAEAVRVVSMLKGFTPGKQGGIPVNVWYMVPITFNLPKTDTPQ
jgi:TonB family protein